ncbi:TetR/AcrR family transcriptional regulator [Paenibacillus wynnii]|uniref:TetR/AcrR family transcriptional regulator n=1 Tax=Paenibacillus wynnii TaxID=268407 RepID=UPI0027925A48|nr:TetR/AcrR family transcriptional regulator [Paenibacillus wynnii]MDQ0193523.1 AcrR family transcriptional regulator [Paenibacillus wynnii]
MSEKMDRRQARSKQLMREALLSILEEKSIEGITVTDIANRADINRGTFYLHYRDVADMLDQMKDEAFEQIRNRILQLNPKELMVYADRNEPYPKITLIFEEVERQAGFFKVMFGPHGDVSYINRFKASMETQIFNNLSYAQPQEENRLVPLEFLISYMASANLGVVLHWLQSGMKQTPLELSAIMTNLMNYGPLTSSGLRIETPKIESRKRSNHI